MTERALFDFAEKNGLCLIPILPDGSKRPAIEWKKYQAEKSTPTDWETWKNQGYFSAVVCGQVSDNLAVVDFDSEQAYTEFIRKHPEFSECPIIRTGRGYHIYIKSDLQSTRKIPGGDYKASGGVCITVGATHANGRRYEFVNDIRDIPFISSHELAAVLPELAQAHEPVDIEILKKGVPLGQRDNAAFLLVNYFVGQGKNEQEIAGIMQDWGQRCQPPITDFGKIREKIKRLTRRGAYHIPVLLPPDELGGAAMNTDAEKDLLTLLDAEERPKKFLDIGIHNNQLYYGFGLDGADALLFSDRTVVRNKWVNMELKSGKTQRVLIDEIKKHLDYSSSLSGIAPRISRKTIKKFLTDSSLSVNPKQVYTSIREQILRFMDFGGRDEIADVLTCWILASYIYPIFSWFPHLLFNAPSDSGKTKCATITKKLSFAGYDIGASGGVTPPQIYRTLEGNRGTILLDEFENLDEDTIKLVNQLLNASAGRDAYIIRCESTGKGWMVKKFPIFGPKIAANISGIAPTALSRYISFSWLKTTSPKGRLKPDREKEQASFDFCVEQAYLFMLHHWEKVKGVYDSLSLPQLNNRGEDNWLPLFAIARTIDSFGDSFVEKQLLSFLENYVDIKPNVEDKTRDFFLALYEDIPNTVDEEILPKTIMGYPSVAEETAYLKGPSHWIGRQLSKYFKRKPVAKGTVYLLSKGKIRDIIFRYWPDFLPTEKELEKPKDNPEEEQLKQSENNPTNTTNTINPTNPTNTSIKRGNGISGIDLLSGKGGDIEKQSVPSAETPEKPPVYGTVEFWQEKIRLFLEKQPDKAATEDELLNELRAQGCKLPLPVVEGLIATLKARSVLYERRVGVLALV